MFVRQLHYLVALAEHKHFAHAAESCWVSQPALSAGIRQLERELGIMIILRDRRFQGFTPEGERVLVWARQTLASLEGLRQEAALAQLVAGGHLAIGTVPSALRAVSMLASEYRRAIPKLTLEVFSLSTRDIFHRLKNKEIHLGIAYADGSDAAIEGIVLYSERFVLLSSDQAGLPNKSSYSWAEAARLPLCLFNHEMQNRKIVDAALLQAGVAPNVVVETNTLSVLYEEVRTGEVCSIAPVSALPDYFLASGINIRPLEPQQLSAMSLLRLRQETPPAVVGAAWDMTPQLDLQGRLDGVLERPAPWLAS
ncbi:LysR family transcriptional regulator [Dyella sp. GSA-30]|uniref:LysR family transcriptional regulator n=1 Tax=Dyella sp. GSA-30 TaxID=2994496 RepID=UPI002491B9A4|nr:LysR family transcriptional regulator [Dyella sp. GSA-30]BDU19067.1 LysR family transcriptional regulator [Dyella sp. GSA-30]